MNETTVGIRELKTRLGAYLKQVKTGMTLVITERGRPIGRVMPIQTSPKRQVHELIQAGILAWSGHRLKPRQPKIRARGARGIAELLLEDRE